MSFDEIMKEIASGLTGDSDHDLQYLQEQCEKYKESEYAKEIIRACGRLIYECIPQEKRDEINAFADKNRLGIEAAIDEANYNVHKKNYEMAEKILTDMVKKVEELDMFKDDRVSEYHSFGEPMQDVLYGYLTHPEKDIRHTSEPFSELYRAYGSFLFEVKRIKEAQEALAKAYHWNPADPAVIFEYGETYKQLGDIEGFFALNRKAFDYSICSKDVARCCRNAAYYFVEKREWKTAVGYLLCSLSYDKENPYAQSELYYIQNTAGEAIEKPASKEMEQIAEKYDIPFGPASHVIGLSYQLAQSLYEKANYEMAHYFAGIAYDLTEADEIKQMLDSIEERLKELEG